MDQNQNNTPYSPQPAPQAAYVPPPSPPDPTPTEPLSKKDINVYNTSKRSVFFRNFIAGLGHALGAAFVYFVLLSVIGYFTSKYLMPQLQPLFKAFESIGNLSSNPPTNQLPYRPEQVNEILNQIQSSQNQ